MPPTNFHEIKKDTKSLFLTESFLSIQGEGKYAGIPSVFLRFGGCNLTCKGFGCESISPLDGSKLVGCDSIFAVDKKHFGKSWEKLCDKELFEKVMFYTKELSYKPHIVITGGEPLIHHKHKDFYGLLKLLDDFFVFVETNATTVVDFEKFNLYKNVSFCMSVKLSNSGESYIKRVNQKAIEAICKNAKEAFFKFVLDEQMIKEGKAQKEIEDIVKDYTNISIYCMPLGKNKKELETNSKSVISFCIKNGYNYTDRIHVRLWNDKRGV
ncbi:MAG: 7-carboxy-7-deazaguanine synthase QueE [Campylobacteraceae bacterium]|jgi:6-pyruvoyltetrahydropterin 2'-reductase|nr:7-carboxy-7-deazaguanine synthase QueE [Campylobacteraceae bacterium]